MKKKGLISGLFFISVLIFSVLIFLTAAFVSCERKVKKGASAGSDEEQIIGESEKQRDERMAWWREARFGMFIHWGLYAVPAGEWQGQTNHAEWILTTAQIPVKEYEKFAVQFNPIEFDAGQWVRTAKKAGMKYIVITSKHHDGFCLFDSKLTDYDAVDATPFKRDILKELSDECRKQGIKICWYHSIMDWHHPDYLPRRRWEDRPTEGADFNRYIKHMKGQLEELVSNYGEIGVLWFDGEWENTWNYEKGNDLYRYVRALKPGIIINNRVGKGRAGMAGTFDPKTSAGDFGTPEQEIPATGLGYDWETCMTMNDHWGYNKNDRNWKSTEDLIRKLVDISSKGGNFLLNIGPTAEGLFPQPCLERLAEIGKWMEVNGESIYGTSASLFEKLDWGRTTTKPKKLFFHIFDWPEEGRLRLPGLISRAESAYLLAEPKTRLSIDYQPGSAVISLPEKAPDPVASVIALEFREEPEVVRAPVVSAESDIFLDRHEVKLSSHLDNVEIRYTLDGSEPNSHSLLYRKAIRLRETATIKCQIFRDGQAVSDIVEKTFTRAAPRLSEKNVELDPGLLYSYYQGRWEKMPEFNSLDVVDSGRVGNFDLSLKKRVEDFAFRFSGFIKVPKHGVYKFYLTSDDGSRLFIGDKLVVDNDGLHGSKEVVGFIVLQAGVHPITVEFFQRSGEVNFDLSYSGPGFSKQPVPASSLFHSRR
jgi:alpha-L-fucosidase